jgi:hypothetical protein
MHFYLPVAEMSANIFISSPWGERSAFFLACSAWAAAS